MTKFADVNKKIEDAVVGGYEKIEETVVSGYEKVEDTVVGGFKKVEDKFVDTFLKREGETTEEAKERILKEQAEVKAKQEKVLDNMPKYSKTTEEIQTEINEKYGN